MEKRASRERRFPRGFWPVSIFCLMSLSGAFARAQCAEDLSSKSVENPSFFERFAANLAREKEIRFSLPYAQTPVLTGRMTPLPIHLDAFPRVNIALAQFAHQSIIPAAGRVESWHAIVRNLNGFYYYLNFPTKEERALFLENTFAQNILADGDTDQRFGIFLTPQQFSQLSEVAKVNGLEFYSAHFLPIARRDLPDDWISFSTSGGTKYFFDPRGKVKAVAQGGRHFAFQDSSPSMASASHAMILARQNLNLDVSRFTQNSERDIAQAANEELARVIEQVEASADLKTNQDVLAAETRLLDTMQDEVTLGQRLRDKTSSFRFSFERFARLRSARVRNFCAQSASPVLLKSLNMACGVSNDLAKSLDRAKTQWRTLSVAERQTFSPIYRFVWIKDLPPTQANGFYLDERGALIHEQLLRLILGGLVSDRLASQDLLRGGMVKLEFDASGRIQRFRVVGEAMTLVIDGQVRRISLSAIERSNLELLLLNADLEKPSR